MSLDSGGAARLARRAQSHDLVERAARAGVVARAVVWLLIGLLAASVALGRGAGQQSDQGGALRAVADSPGGVLLLVALTVGFAGYSAYKLLCAAVGHRGEDSRALHRLKSAGEALLYAGAALASLRTVLGRSPDSEGQARSLTASVMELPFGRVLVGVIGAVAVVVAGVLVVRALRHDHSDGVARAPAGARRPLLRLGVAGLAGRSLAITLVGAFLVDAAVRFDPGRAKGLDAALDAVAAQPFGALLLLVAAASLVCYGLWSLVEAVWGEV